MAKKILSPEEQKREERRSRHYDLAITMEDYLNSINWRDCNKNVWATMDNSGGYVFDGYDGCVLDKDFGSILVPPTPRETEEEYNLRTEKELSQEELDKIARLTELVFAEE